MATTSNFGWSTPDDTDLVKDGALAIRTLGNNIDTSLVDLKGGTTGQILSKNSNTDLDYTWINNDQGDITEVQAGTGISVASGTGPVPVVTNTVATTFDAKGDLVVGTGADTFAKLTTGNNGETLVADSSQTTGLRWANNLGYTAGKNRIINGNMALAQRGTSFTASNNNDDVYTLDRWYILSDTNDVIDVTRATDVPTNGLYSIGLDVETVNKKFGIAQIIEQGQAIGLIGNTVTLSFKAKVSSTTKLDNVKAAIVAWSGTADTVTSDIISAWNVEGTNPTLIANATYENTPANLNVTTSWASYSITAAIDTASTTNVIVFIWSDVTDTTLGDFLYITDVQLETGSIPTAFQTAAGTPQGELALAQRYYYRQGGSNSTETFALGFMLSTTSSLAVFNLPSTMRVAPTAIDYATLYAASAGGSNAITALALNNAGRNSVRVDVTHNAFGAGGTGMIVYANSSTSAYVGFSAEL